MHSKSDNIEIIIGNATDDNIKELFPSLLTKYKIGLKESIKGSDFFFDSIDELHYKFHKISLNCDGTCIDFPD